MRFFRRTIRNTEINPEEIFLDSSNRADFDAAQFEGRVERPISSRALVVVAGCFVLGALIFLGRAFDLQIMNGTTYADISRENRLERSVIFAPRGIIYDRTGEMLAWNDLAEASTTDPIHEVVPLTFQDSYAKRKYTDKSGFAHVVGFVRYPKKDEAGEWWREEYTGVAGIERAFNTELAGKNGSVLVETDARGRVQRGHVVVPPESGKDLHTTLDLEVQHKLFTTLSHHANVHGFRGGAAVVMDVKSGELLALTSFPEYDNAAFTEGTTEAIEAANKSAFTPLLNRAVAGLYTPGSIVKPIFAAAALAEHLISPEREILSTGQLVVPNPYDASKPSIFRDWKAHGWVDMREAIAVSSDVYFYTIGGGFGGQAGLGIQRLDDYARRFGLGSTTGFILGGEEAGVIPTPEWKEEVFDGDPWRLGDTYITSIGQFGFQLTPLQAVRFTAAVANGGWILTPHIVPGAREAQSVGIDDALLTIVREGMHEAVVGTEGSPTARALAGTGVSLAAKTGTAELGDRKQYMNSWVVGFWPHDNPRYAFAVVLEKAPAGTLAGASPAMRSFFEWLALYKPEYVQGKAVAPLSLN